MEKKINDKQICRAEIVPQSESTEFDFEAVAVPAINGQIKYSWENKEYFKQVLRTSPENINTERLESGLPIFDNHPEMEDAGVMNQLGITTDFGFDERGLVVRCKLGARADDALRLDIKNKISKTVSIEGEINEYSMDRTPGQIPVYYAEKWTPYSLSFAPVPNDIGAQIEVKRAIQKQIEKTENPKPEKEDKYKILINKF